MFGKTRHPDGPRGFYTELKQLCTKYGVVIHGSEFGIHFTIQGSGLWHSEEFSEDTKEIDNLKLE